MIETEQFTIKSMELGPMENFVYVITDKHSRRSAVVDPAWDPEQILQCVEHSHTTLTDILLTHSHNDHINAVESVLDQYDAQVHLSKAEFQFWDGPLKNPALHHGGEVIQLGQTQIELMHTPGHTPGSACFRLGEYLISGDTMFVFGCGRCDLRGGDPNQMYATLRQIKSSLPATTVVLPGHNYSTIEHCTMQEQIEGNPFMHIEDPDTFTRFRMHTHDRMRHSPYLPVMKSAMHQYLE